MCQVALVTRFHIYAFVVCHSVVSASATTGTAACQASLSFTIFQGLLKVMSIESVITSNHLILYCPPSSPALNLSQHQDLIQWVGSSHQVAKLLELHLWYVFTRSIQGWFSLGLTGLISLLFKGVSRIFFSNIVWKQQFLGTQPSLWSNSLLCIWLWKNHSFD